MVFAHEIMQKTIVYDTLAKKAENFSTSWYDNQIGSKTAKVQDSYESWSTRHTYLCLLCANAAKNGGNFHAA